MRKAIRSYNTDNRLPENIMARLKSQAIEIAKLRKELADLRMTSEDYSCQCHNWIYTVDELHRELIE